MACVDRMEQADAVAENPQGNGEPRATRTRVATAATAPSVEEEDRQPTVKVRRKRTAPNVPTESIALQVSDGKMAQFYINLCNN